MSETVNLKEQPDIKELIYVLESNGLKRGQQEVESLVDILENIGEQFTQMLGELQAVRGELANMQNKGIRATVSRTLENAEGKTQEILGKIFEIRKNLVCSAKNAVAVFKEKGVDALRKAVSAMKIPQVLSAIKSEPSPSAWTSKTKGFYPVLSFSRFSLLFCPLRLTEYTFQLLFLLCVFIQKQLCCFPICLMLSVVFLRCQIAVCLVNTFSVIKYPYILEHCRFCFFSGSKMLVIQPFLLQFPPETLHRGIVPTVPFPAHTADKSMLFCQFLIIQRAVLASPVGVQDTAFCSRCMADRIFQRRYYKFLCHMPVHRYADYFISAKVHDPGKIEPAFPRRDICDVAYHFLSGSVSGKIPVQDIFRNREAVP